MGLDNPLHIAFLLILLLLVFGAKRLPEMGRSLGSGMRGFKDTLSGEHTHEPHGETVPAIPAEAPAVRPPAKPRSDVRIDLRLWGTDSGKMIRVRAPETITHESLERLLQALKLHVRIEG